MAPVAFLQRLEEFTQGREIGHASGLARIRSGVATTPYPSVETRHDGGMRGAGGGGSSVDLQQSSCSKDANPRSANAVCKVRSGESRSP